MNATTSKGTTMIGVKSDRANVRPLSARGCLLTLALGVVAAGSSDARASSNGLIGESTNDYSYCNGNHLGDLPNSYSNTHNFLYGMSNSGTTTWSVWSDWSNND